MSDRLHQPYRANLVPGMALILEEAPRHGALGVALSGAGPTLLALVDRREYRKMDLEAYLLDTMKTHGIQATAKWLEPSSMGVTISGTTHSNSFMDMIKGEVEA
ncbi:homoserine kinase [compost metagenome]